MPLENIPNLRHRTLISSNDIKGDTNQDGEGLFIRGCSDRTQGNGFKLIEGRVRLNIRKKKSSL